MIVVDASAFVEFLTDENGLARAVAEELYRDGEWVCPSHTTIEVASALRGLWLGGRSTKAEFLSRMSALGQLDPDLVAAGPLLPRIVDLAENASPYDAAYVALAEHLRAPLITTDGKLARISSGSADVRVLTA